MNSPAITNPHDRLGEMRAWCDAFTVQIEAQGQAYQDPELRKTVVDAVAAAQSAVGTASEKDKAVARDLLANQKRVLEFIDRFDWEAFKDYRAAWKRVRAELLRTSFDLRQSITFTTGDDGITRLSQRGCGAPLRLTGREATVAVEFLRWVDASQQQFDPLHYTKMLLARSGIRSSSDFEANKDKMAITNPWAESPRIIAP